MIVRKKKEEEERKRERLEFQYPFKGHTPNNLTSFH
jgi:hypothetical protein